MLIQRAVRFATKEEALACIKQHYQHCKPGSLAIVSGDQHQERGD